MLSMSLQVPKLDDLKFKELFEEARNLIPRYAQQWTDHNLSDPGVTLIEMFSWLAEMQIYSLDQVSEKQVRAFLKLLQKYPRSAEVAEVAVAFTLEKGQNPVSLNAGSQVAARDFLIGLDEIFEITERLTIHDLRLTHAIRFTNGIWHDASDTLQTLHLHFNAFNSTSPHNACLYLGFASTQVFPQTLRLRFDIYKGDLPAITPLGSEEWKSVFPSMHLNWELWTGSAWQSLEIEDRTVGLNHSGIVVFSNKSGGKTERLPVLPDCSGAPTTDMRYWLRIVPRPGKGDCYEIPPRIESIQLNAVDAKHGYTVWNEKYNSTGLPYQSITLKNLPVIPESVILKVENKIWQQVLDFDASGPDDGHFVLDPVKGIIYFGNGKQGSIPEPGDDVITVTRYRCGGGLKGNVRSNAISLLDKPKWDGVSVNNMRPGFGGKEAENLGEAQKRARRDVKESTRILADKDIESLVHKIPGVYIQRVKVLAGYHPEISTITMPNTTTIVVVPMRLANNQMQMPIPSNGMLKTIHHQLISKRLITSDLHVIGAQFIDVSIETEIRAKPRINLTHFKTMVLDLIRRYLDPMSGGPEKKGWPIGRFLYASDLYGELTLLEGLDSIAKLSLGSNGNRSIELIKIPRVGLIGKVGIRLRVSQ